MTQKIGRNDPCSCGSGKKYKQCCLTQNRPATQRKIKAKVLSVKPTKTEEGAAAPAGPDLIERTFAPVFHKPAKTESSES